MNVLKRVVKSRLFLIVILLLILIALPLTVFFAQQQQETRQRANESSVAPRIQAYCETDVCTKLIIKWNISEINDKPWTMVKLTDTGNGFWRQKFFRGTTATFDVQGPTGSPYTVELTGFNTDFTACDLSTSYASPDGANQGACAGNSAAGEWYDAPGNRMTPITENVGAIGPLFGCTLTEPTPTSVTAGTTATITVLAGNKTLTGGYAPVTVQLTKPDGSAFPGSTDLGGRHYRTISSSCTSNAQNCQVTIPNDLPPASYNVFCQIVPPDNEPNKCSGNPVCGTTTTGQDVFTSGPCAVDKWRSCSLEDTKTFTVTGAPTGLSVTFSQQQPVCEYGGAKTNLSGTVTGSPTKLELWVQKTGQSPLKVRDIPTGSSFSLTQNASYDLFPLKFIVKAFDATNPNGKDFPTNQLEFPCATFATTGGGPSCQVISGTVAANNQVDFWLFNIDNHNDIPTLYQKNTSGACVATKDLYIGSSTANGNGVFKFNPGSTIGPQAVLPSSIPPANQFSDSTCQTYFQPPSVFWGQPWALRAVNITTGSVSYLNITCPASGVPGQCVNDNQCPAGQTCNQTTNRCTGTVTTPPTTSPTATVPTTSPTVTISPNGALQFSFSLRGIGLPGQGCTGAECVDNPTPKHTDRAAMLCLYAQGAKAANDPECNNATYRLPISSTTSQGPFFGPVLFNTTTKLFGGSFNLPENFQSATYDVLLKVKNYLRKRVSANQQVTKGQVNQLPEVRIVAMDLNNDNQLNILDYNIFWNCLNRKAACVNGEASDFNDDGIIDRKDLTIFGTSFQNQSGD